MSLTNFKPKTTASARAVSLRQHDFLIKILTISCFNRTARILERLTGKGDLVVDLTSVDSVSSRSLRSAADDHEHPYATDILYVGWTLHNKISCWLQLRKRII